MFGEIDEKIRHEWALKLVKKLVGAPTVENASLLADLYDSAESEWLDIIDSLRPLLESPIDNSHVLSSLLRLDPLRASFLAQLNKDTTLFRNWELNLIPQFSSFTAGGTEDYVSPVKLTSLLAIVKDMIRVTRLTDLPDQLQQDLLVIQGSKVEELAVAASDVVGQIIGHNGFAVKNEEFIWQVIHGLLDADAEYCWSSAYKLWLRWINRTDIKSDSIFVKLFNTDDYWRLIQLGILSPSYERKKFALYILSRSIQTISTDIFTKFMQWKLSEQKLYSGSWQRYITLIELVSIDTSLNQTTDSLGDILNIASSSSVIPHTWGIALLTAGLNSTMDSIRQLMATTVLTFTTDQMKLFSEDVDFIPKVLLPYTMSAPFFYVTESMKCPHGQKLADFVANLMTVSDDANIPLQGILNMLYEMRFSYDPARIQVTRGLSYGLKGKQVINSDNVEILRKLASAKAETRLRQRALFIYSVCVLLSAQVDDESQASGLYNALSQYLESYPEFYKDVISQVSSAVSGNKILGDNLKLLSGAFKVEVAANLGDEYSHEMCRQLCVNEKAWAVCNGLESTTEYLLGAQRKEFVSELKSAIAKGQPEPTLIDAMHRMGETVSLGDSVIDYLTAVNVDQLENAVRLAQVSNEIKQCSVKELYNFLATNLGGQVPVSQRRGREAIVTVMYRIVRERVDDLGFELDLGSVLQTAVEHFSSNSAECRLAVCEFLNSVAPHLTSDQVIQYEDIGDSLMSLWDDLEAERLVLAQREVHLSFMDFAFNPAFLEATRNAGEDGGDENLVVVLEDIGHRIIEQSYARRSLMPRLAILLSQSTGQEWIARVMSSLYVFQQMDNNLFRMELVIANTLDSEYGMSSYQDAYGYPEISAKAIAIGYLSRADFDAQNLFANLQRNYKIFAPVKRNDAVEEAVRVNVMQIVLLLERQLDLGVKEPEVIDKFMAMIDTEPSPSVRTYVEWVICKVLVRSGQKGTDSVLHKLERSEDQPRVLASFQRMGFIIASYMKDRRFFQQYLRRIIALSTSNRATVRHGAVSMVYACAKHATEYLDSVKDQELIETVQNIATNAQAAESFKHFRSGDRLTWGLESDLTLVGVCGGVLRRIADRPVMAISSRQFDIYLHHAKIDTNVPIGQDDNNAFKTGDNGEDEDGSKVSKNPVQASFQLQTKSGAWQAGGEEEGDQDERVQVQRGEMIVVASLVDKAPNLGGICRLCDVLGAQQMCVNDIAVTQHSEFKNVAVTADRWMPMAEVKIDDMTDYFNQKKHEGYKIIGLEQTDKSVELTRDLEFPRKCVLVLGKEREGIPGHILTEVDYCVEIKQVGVIRSMNIQTATAVVVHAYSLQHC